VPDSAVAYATSRRRARRQPSKEVLDEQLQRQTSNADDIVDISYVGASIPSRTFRILQQAVGSVAPHGKRRQHFNCFNFLNTQ